MTNYQNEQYKNEKNEQEQQKKQQQYSTNTSTSTNTRSRACTSDPIISMQIEQLTPVYKQMFGTPNIPIAIAQYFARLIRAGMEPGVIASAINATAWARVPTPYYMRAILQRYMAEGIMTEQQLQHDMLEQQEKRYSQRQNMDEMMYFD